MKVRINEHELEVAAGETVHAVRSRMKPGADIIIINGAVCDADTPLRDGDSVVLIHRGEQPSREELEMLMAARHTPGVHAKLKRATVGIAGLGGLGSSIAIALARTGVGRMILVDFDIVEPSNLNRQQYFVSQIGQPKPDALVENLRLINPYNTYEPLIAQLDPANVPVIFSGVDLLIEAFDRADMKAMLAAAFKGAYPDRPLVMASGLAGCGPENTLRVRKLGGTLYVVGDLETAARPGVGLMAPRVGIAAHMQANLAVRLLLSDCKDIEV